MGYTHYWATPQRLEAALFKVVVKDSLVIAEAVKEYGVRLAGPGGTGEPIFTAQRIRFNGAVNCGHAIDPQVVIPWPSDDAGGVAQPGEDGKAGSWFAGTTLATRTCNGDCSYESFVLDRIYKPFEWQQPDDKGRWFQFCKTAYRPYDLAVTAVLLIAKHHFGEAIRVSSDGTDAQWWDTKMLCYTRLGYGPEYRFDAEAGLVQAYDDADQALRASNRQDLANKNDC